ncbi:MAG: zinc metallopeptidase [Candidatus Eiseniibacteriota bacterium]|nr:MAG: zinc metallopeptidase [Candidatus Eisenbacteria bacterium]
MLFWDPTFVLLIPALALAFYAQYKVRSTYQQFLRVPSSSGRKGREVASAILRRNNLGDIKIERSERTLSDHYDPRAKVLRLSPEVYEGSSVAALGIAAHEAGHAIQDGASYAPLRIRHGLFPVANVGTVLAFPLFLLGFLFQFRVLMDIGILFFAGAVLFQVVTLPVEFNASKRALSQLEGTGLVDEKDLAGGRKVLNAAALTYVAAAAVAATHLIRLLVLRGSRE